MVEIKLSADNVRLLQGAKTEAELRGAVALVLERVAQAETVKSFGGAKKRKSGTNPYGVWQHVRDVLRSVLGDNLRLPPHPDGTWTRKIYYSVTEAGMTDEYLVRLAEHARDHMRMPIQMQFLVCMHERVLAGEWDQDKPGAKERRLVDVWKQTKMPEE